ncbi:MAG: DUF4115 domain-containing protein [Betaproteobacteria bacterium]|nr:DUF4115 domain-containing protein [Betaproteobacteria bacterium]
MKDEVASPSEFSAPSDSPVLSGISPAVEVGRRLYAAREAARLSQAELASRLRLGERQVVALETGNLAALPGKTFARGFVRNYALAVALDPQPLLAMLEQAPGLTAPTLDLPKPIRVTMPLQGQTAQKRDRLIITLGIALFVMAVVIYFFAPQHLELKLASEAPENIPIAPVAHEASIPEPVPVAPAPAEEEHAPDTHDALPAITAAFPVSASSPPAQDNGNLRLEFQGTSWVEITDKNEQRLHSHLHEANSSHELTITPPVTIVIGRASGVRLYYQGEPRPLQPNSNDVATVKLQ